MLQTPANNSVFANFVLFAGSSGAEFRGHLIQDSTLMLYIQKILYSAHIEYIYSRWNNNQGVTNAILKRLAIPKKIHFGRHHRCMASIIALAGMYEISQISKLSHCEREHAVYA